jgi:hypothetical protein
MLLNVFRRLSHIDIPPQTRNRAAETFINDAKEIAVGGRARR